MLGQFHNSSDNANIAKIANIKMLSSTRSSKKIQKISVFKNYVSQLRISSVTTGSDAVKHLLLIFKRLSDEIGSRSHTCLGYIKIRIM